MLMSGNKFYGDNGDVTYVYTKGVFVAPFDGEFIDTSWDRHGRNISLKQGQALRVLSVGGPTSLMSFRRVIL